MNKKIINMVYIAVATALIVVCSWIALPSAVPITMQTFAIFTVLGLLGGRNGTIAIFLYVFIGALGLPVFSHFKGGLPIILHDVAGGYIIGFLFMAVIYWAAVKMFGCNIFVRTGAMYIGLLACYIVGTLWYIKINLDENTVLSFFEIMSVCVFPFVIPDMLKLVFSVLIVKKIRTHISPLLKSK